MANSPILSTTVMPFILRGVSLLGISSTNCPYDLRIKAWDFINSIYKKNNGKVSIPLSFIELEQVIDISKQMLSRQTKGRFIIKFN
jgi:NADPH2:quinone reductase